MKPLNLDNRPCSPISSNCVIWQGPDIPCIKLCTGDTVSDIVYKLGTELCTIMDQLKVSNYDLSCLGINACPPEDFQALIQLLIDKICELNGITPDEGKSSGCPDCVVSVAECFIEGNNTNMQLIDYVQMIANRVCSILSEIDLINNSITNLVNITNDLQNQIDNLPVYELPKITLTCEIGPYGIGTQVSLDTLVGTFLNTVWCPFYAATGTTTELLTAVAQKCILDGTLQLSTGTPYGTNPNWIADANYNTVADAINNIWVVLCDVFGYIENFEGSTSVVAAGEGITVTSATVGSTTTYTVENDYLETFLANVTIKNTYAPDSGNIPKVLPSSVNGVQEGQVILKYTSVSSNGNLVTANATCTDHVTNACLPPLSFGTFDNTTGLFTITDPGTYLISASIHLKPDNGSTVYWSGTTAADIGSFLIGIHPNNNSDTYVADGQVLIPNIDRNVEISTSKIIVASNGTTLRVKVLNTTNRDYDGRGYAGADGISFGIIKLRNDLISTTCPTC
jgi:hypothetical protein